MKLLEIFSKFVLDNEVLESTHKLQQGRLMANLGLPTEAENLFTQANGFNITDEERKVQFEKIKALKDTKDDSSGVVSFTAEKSSEPRVIELIRIHESWLAYAEEIFKWGEFTRCKDLAVECTLHARILKDQDSYCKALLLQQKLTYIEGNSAESLKIAMQCQANAKSMPLVEQTIVQTFRLLYSFKKWNDMESLLTGAVNMVTGLRRLSEGKQAEGSKT